MGTFLFIAAVAVGCWLFWMLMDEVFEAVSHTGARDEVKRLRRTFVERRLGNRRDPERRGSPPPLVERRKGQRRSNLTWP